MGVQASGAGVATGIGVLTGPASSPGIGVGPVTAGAPQAARRTVSAISPARISAQQRPDGPGQGPASAKEPAHLLGIELEPDLLALGNSRVVDPPPDHRALKPNGLGVVPPHPGTTTPLRPFGVSTRWPTP